MLIQTIVYPPNLNKYCLAEEQPHLPSVGVSGRLKGSNLQQHRGQTLSHSVSKGDQGSRRLISAATSFLDLF